VIQVGDLGIGFTPHQELVAKYDFKFIRGNHDNPELCKTVKGYLGDYGVERFENGQTYFFVSGARSIDSAMRFPGYDWWKEEELGYSQAMSAINRYAENTPDFVISHDAPTDILTALFSHHTNYGMSLTNQMLQRMLDIHVPRVWFFGHHHISFNEVINGCRFICLAEGETYQLD